MSDKPWFVEGLRRYRAGERLRWSSDWDGDPTWGYGRLDGGTGYWEFPVAYEDLREEHKDLIRSLLASRGSDAAPREEK